METRCRHICVEGIDGQFFIHTCLLPNETTVSKKQKPKKHFGIEKLNRCAPVREMLHAHTCCTVHVNAKSGRVRALTYYANHYCMPQHFQTVRQRFDHQHKNQKITRKTTINK